MKKSYFHAAQKNVTIVVLTCLIFLLFSPQIFANVEKVDETATAKHGGIAFVGSSSIMFWFKLKKDFASLPVFRFGVAGANFHHVESFTSLFVIRRKPRIIVVYAGENDVTVKLPGFRKSPADVAHSFTKFAESVHAKLPKTWIFFLAIKPSPKRFDHWPDLCEANALVADSCNEDPRLFYLDGTEALLPFDASTPTRELYAWDGLHLNRRGYRAWASILGPILEECYDRHRSSFRNW